MDLGHWGLGFGFWHLGVGFRVSGFVFSGFGCWVSECWVSGARTWVLSFVSRAICLCGGLLESPCSIHP